MIKHKQSYNKHFSLSGTTFDFGQKIQVSDFFYFTFLYLNMLVTFLLLVKRCQFTIYLTTLFAHTMRATTV